MTRTGQEAALNSKAMLVQMKIIISVFRDLFEACKSGDLSRVRDSVTAANVNAARDTAGRRSTPLHFAAGEKLGKFTGYEWHEKYYVHVSHVYLCKGYGRRDAVEHLLSVGANVHSRDDGGLIPLHNACSFGHAEVVALLLGAGEKLLLSFMCRLACMYVSIWNVMLDVGY